MAKIKVHDSEWLDEATDLYLGYERGRVGTEDRMKEMLTALMHGYGVGLVPGSYSYKKKISEQINAQLARLFPVTQGYMRKLVDDLCVDGVFIKDVDGRRIRSLRITEHFEQGYEDVSVVDFIDTFIGHVVEVTHGVLKPWMPFYAKAKPKPAVFSATTSVAPVIPSFTAVVDAMVPAALYKQALEIANQALDVRDLANAKFAEAEKKMSAAQVDCLMWKDRAKKAEARVAELSQHLHPSATNWGTQLKALEGRL